jgi:hypothetical protein
MAASRQMQTLGIAIKLNYLGNHQNARNCQRRSNYPIEGAGT